MKSLICVVLVLVGCGKTEGGEDSPKGAPLADNPAVAVAEKANAVKDLEARTPKTKETLPAAATIPTAPDRYLSKTGYKGTRWGMNPAEVMNIVGGSSVQGRQFIIVNVVGSAAGFDANTQFAFVDEALAVIIVRLDPSGYGSDNSLVDYEVVTKLLTGKYGDPGLSEVLGDAKNIKKKDWSYNLTLGNIEFKEVWEDEELEIVHTLDGGKSPEHRIQYASVKLRSDVTAATKRQNADSI